MRQENVIVTFTPECEAPPSRFEEGLRTEFYCLLTEAYPFFRWRILRGLARQVAVTYQKWMSAQAARGKEGIFAPYFAEQERILLAEQRKLREDLRQERLQQKRVIREKTFQPRNPQP